MRNVYFILTLCVLFWSGNFIVGRYIHNDIEPLQLALFRWIGVALVFLPVLILNLKKIISAFKSNWFILNILAILSVTGFNTLLYVALQNTSATNALLINSVVPVEILLLSYFILKIKIVFRQFLGIILSMFGVVYLVLKGDVTLLSTLEFSKGDIWVFLAGLTWAVYSVLMKFKPKELNGIVFLTTLVYVGLFWIYLIYLYFGYSLSLDIKLVEKYYLVFIYVSIFASILSYIFWNMGIEKIGANQTSQFTHLMPLFGSFLAYIFLGEVLEVYHILGALIIAMGIYLSLFSKVSSS